MGKIRYPLAEKYMNRVGALSYQDPAVSLTYTQDAYIQNAYIDKYGEKLYVMKRPGTTLNFDFGVAAVPQGQTYFNGLIYAVYNDILYRSSGTQNTGTNASTFTTTGNAGWSTRVIHASVVFQGKMWVIGGFGDFTYSDVWSSQDGVTWSVVQGGAPFSSRNGMGLVVFNNLMWAIGGLDITNNVYKNDVWSTPDGVTWTSATNTAAFSARTQFGCVAANGGIYVYGGYDGTNFLNDVWFSSNGVAWTKLLSAAPWAVRSSAACTVFNNKIWVIAGQNGSGGAATLLNDVWSSLNGTDWTQTTSSAFASARYGSSVVVYNNNMWVMGGGISSTTSCADVYSSSNGTTWALVTASPGWSSRLYHTALVFQTPYTVNQYQYSSIWIMGGGPQGVTRYNDVWYGNINAPLQTSYALNPTTTGQRYQFNTFVNGQYMLIKNGTDFWVLSSGTLVKVNDPNYPTQTVPGIVVLNQYAYVMTPQGVIRACALNDATLWPALQFTVASYEDDAGVCLSKYLNYIVAFGTYTTQFYYDNANPAPGISISAYINANIRVGLVNAASVQSVDNTLIWIGQTSNRQWGVYMLNGMNPQRVSNSWVDAAINKYLADGLPLYTFMTGSNGHKFYVINFFFSHRALVYDVDYKEWYTWSWNTLPFFSGTLFPFVAAITTFLQQGDLWFDAGGKVYYSSFNSYDDNGTQFPMIVQTDKIDDNKMVNKFWGRLDFVADHSNANVTINTSDDDYQTFRQWGVVNLAGTRPSLNRGGASRRRAFQIIQQDSNPARWEAIELTVSEGES